MGSEARLNPDDDGLTPFETAVIAVLRSTEPGDVMAYGEVAAEAGFPGAARAVGSLLRRFEDLPWWRIVNASGRLVPGHQTTQSELLAAEGIKTRNGRVTASR